MSTTLARNNVTRAGGGERAMVFAQGFGCDQHMWRRVAPAFEGDFQTIVLDHVGAGSSDLWSVGRLNRPRATPAARSTCEVRP
jgi:sigma-B regulation protein RsbQ